MLITSSSLKLGQLISELVLSRPVYSARWTEKQRLPCSSQDYDQPFCGVCGGIHDTSPSMREPMMHDADSYGAGSTLLV